MKKRKHFHSLRYRIITLMAASLLLTCTIIISYNYYIYRMMARQMTQTITDTLDLYTEEVSFSLDNAEAFLVNKCLSHDTIRKIRDPRNALDRYLAISDMNNLFQSSIDSYHLMDGLFLYDRENAIFIGAAQNNSDHADIFQYSMGRLLRAFEASASDMKNEWFSFTGCEQYFLVKMFEVQNVYIGCWIDVDTVIGNLQKISTGSTDLILMLDAEHRVLRQDFPLDTIETDRSVIKLDKSSYKVLRSKTIYPAFSFLVLRNQERTWQSFRGIGLLITVTAVFILLLCFSVAVIQKRFFDKPITRLVDAMNALKNGNLQVRIQEENVFDEFRIVNDTFDSMIKDIEKLKIDVYEEKLNKQHAELLYLQEQINPHFLTNCMNLIRNLSLTGQNSKVQKAAVLVSNHMRYSLAYSTQVSLERELKHVENYEKLQKMRYGDQFTLTINAADSLMDCQIPTMLIQVFVENAIKHQLDPKKQLLIEVSLWADDGKWLHLEIRDSGDGFPQEILQQLNAQQKLINSEGEHIGIYNVCQRLKILYGEKAFIGFSNGATRGAQIHIRIPLQI